MEEQAIEDAKVKKARDDLVMHRQLQEQIAKQESNTSKIEEFNDAV
jgi:hypothetical protein